MQFAPKASNVTPTTKEPLLSPLFAVPMLPSPPKEDDAEPEAAPVPRRRAAGTGQPERLPTVPDERAQDDWLREHAGRIEDELRAAVASEPHLSQLAATLFDTFHALAERDRPDRDARRSLAMRVLSLEEQNRGLRRAQELLLEEIGQAMNETSRLQQDVDQAREIQRAFVDPQRTAAPGLEVVIACRPAKETSGDCVHLSRTARNELAIFVGDATGHGYGPGLLSAAMTGALASMHLGAGRLDPERPEAVRANIGRSPSGVLALLDRVVAELGAGACAMAGMYALLDSERGELRFASAGHCPPILVPATRQGKQEMPRVLPATGPLLGASPNGLVSRRERTAVLAPGDLLALHTDGVIDCRDENQRALGRRRLAGWLDELRDESLEVLRQELLARIEQYSAAAGDRDDLTLVLIRLGHASE